MSDEKCAIEKDGIKGEFRSFVLMAFALQEKQVQQKIGFEKKRPARANWSVAVIVTTLPRAVRVIEHTLIPLKDGVTLAARIWLPKNAEQDPVPAILEYLPYRKRDGTYERDALTHPYLAAHGYAGVRVDIRGCAALRSVPPVYCCPLEYRTQTILSVNCRDLVGAGYLEPSRAVDR